MTPVIREVPSVPVIFGLCDSTHDQTPRLRMILLATISGAYLSANNRGGSLDNTEVISGPSSSGRDHSEYGGWQPSTRIFLRGFAAATADLLLRHSAQTAQ